MTRHLSLLALCSITCLGLMACGDNEEDNNKTTDNSSMMGNEIPDLTNPFADDAAAAAAGATLYSSNCGGCHAADGSPTQISSKDLRQTAANATDGYIYTVLEKGGAGVEGVSSGMPAYAGSLSMDELWQLVTHIRTFKP